MWCSCANSVNKYSARACSPSMKIVCYPKASRAAHLAQRRNTDFSSTLYLHAFPLLISACLLMWSWLSHYSFHCVFAPSSISSFAATKFQRPALFLRLNPDSLFSIQDSLRHRSHIVSQLILHNYAILSNLVLFFRRATMTITMTRGYMYHVNRETIAAKYNRIEYII